MADPTFSYAKKLKAGTTNQVVSDLIIAKGNNGRASYKYSESFYALHKCGINITIHALSKRVEREYKRFDFFLTSFSCRKHTVFYKE